ncbi:MAG: kynureninase [Acidimicrobiia bacterium]|nr:kynureninase [Acidimicrobiia bacterium]
MAELGMGPFPDSAGFAEAQAHDAADALAEFRSRFISDDPELIYLDGNSLGRLPAATSDHLEEVIAQEWGSRLIGSWGEGWWTLGRDTGDLLAPLIGAEPGSVVVADSTTVCLFKLAWGALRLRPGRTRVITDDLNFPTDLYVLEAATEAAGGGDVEVIQSHDGINGPVEAVEAALDADVALVTLSHVVFKSGYLYDMRRITEAAHEVGAMVLWDLSHSAGVVPTDLSGVDLAVGCTYKYLNGGPGAPAFMYVNPELPLENPLAGWWGHRRPFDFDLEYRPAADIARFQTGTMPILSLAAITPAAQIVAEAGIGRIRAKSVALTDYLIELADEVLSPLGFTIASPREAARRGSHVSLRHPDAWRVVQAMIDEGRVVPDFREPDNIRLGLAPLYVSFADVHNAVHRIAGLMREDRLSKYRRQRSTVT